MSKLIDLTGQRFGRLTVIKYLGNDKHRRALWLCKCDCGADKTVCGCELRKGSTNSCGCLHREDLSKRRTTHGQSSTRLYRIWGAMIKRCHNPNAVNYSHYGGVGITVFDKWRNSFETFRNWALSNGYQEDLSIDRIDFNGNYEPSNCRWVDIKTQQNNKRNNRLLTYNGETKSLTQWSREIGVSDRALYKRLRRGWSTEETLSTPLGGKRKTK